MGDNYESEDFDYEEQDYGLNTQAYRDDKLEWESIHGGGSVRSTSQWETVWEDIPCRSCNGSGSRFFGIVVCADCNGTGGERRSRQVEVFDAPSKDDFQPWMEEDF